MIDFARAHNPRPLLAAALLAVALCALPAGAQGQLPALLGGALPDLDPNAAGLPASSLVDCSDLLEAPAGKRGFVFVGRDGNFYFEDGARARFWGINVAKDSVFQPAARIDEAIEAIARAGFNLVRLHHVDDVAGLLPPERAGTAEPIDPEKLAALDHWIAACGRRGIYVYLDLLDFRTFYEREGVPNAEELGRGAKPYAVFNERLIELQMAYAQALLTDHVNAETGLSYASDPTVAMVELCDENGLFAAQRKRQVLVSPFREELQRRWNFWLRARYEDTATLRLAWTDWRGECALGGAESLEEGTVTLHADGGQPGQLASSMGAGTRAVGRLNDLALFMASIHREYFAQMKQFLRERGVRVPISAVTDFERIPDLRSVHDELDFMGANYYYDHPVLKDGQWRLPMYFMNRTPLGAAGDSFAPKLTLSACSDRPIVAREWGVCWPNKFRAPGMVEAIAYAALQDIDAMILFTYDIRPEARRLDFFDVSRDPTRWGLAALGARVFMNRAVAEAQHHAEVGYSLVDSHFTNGDTTLGQLYRLAHVTGLRASFFDETWDGESDLMIASGLSSGAVYAGERAVISAEERAEDLLNRRHQATLAENSGYAVATLSAGRALFDWGGTLLGPNVRAERATHPGFSLRAVDANPDYRAIGRSVDGSRAFGLRDMRRSTWVYHSLEPADKLRAALDALGQLYDERIAHAYLETGRFVSDTREIVRDEERELLAVNTPTFQAIAGALENAAAATGRMAVRSGSPIGALCWLSLDGRGPEDSRRWMLKMLTVALNSGERKAHHAGQGERAIFAIEDAGAAPVVTAGQTGAAGTIVELGGRQVASVGLVNGSWEIVRDGAAWYVYCDTPGATIALADAPARATAWAADGETAPVPVEGGGFTWPAGAKLVVLR